MVNANRSIVNPEKWQIQEMQRLKARFADLLFPALAKDNPAPLNELLEAMAKERREISMAKNGVVVYGKKPKLTTKKEQGRHLRQAILSFKPDDLISMRAVEAHLAKWQAAYSDESHVYRVMRELKVHLLSPGDTVYFAFSQTDLATGKPKRIVCPRKFVVNGNRSITNFGMSRKEYDDLNGWKAHRVVSAGSAKPDK